MHRLAAVVFAVIIAAASRGEEPTTARTDPRLPNLPGPYHGYNVTGKFKGRYHSQISEYGLEPMAMIFTRKVAFSDPLKDLLKQIDAVMVKNPAARLHPVVVVQSDGLPEVVGADDKNDDKRIELAQALEDQAKGLMLQDVDDIPIVLVGKADLEKYKLDDAGFAFFLFERGKVTASRVMKTDDSLAAADVKAIMTLHIAPFGPLATALLVTRDADLSDALKDLLKQIDNAAEKNPTSRLHPVLALLSDDAKRNEAAAKLEEQVKALMLKHVEVVAAGASDLQRYDVGDAPFAFYLSQRQAVTAVRALKKDEKLTPGVTAEIMKLLAEKAGADQK
jgi:hypothetical protein